ncbi:MAG: hypothetical protein CMH98_20945 [Oceanospirillaceae bacterium]|nr:hypothetical protein [Oceanospirillaceae bacterium]
MSINLEKGQTIDLSKDKGLKSLEFGLGWSEAEKNKEAKGFWGKMKNALSGGEIDLDASILMTGPDGKALDTVYFGKMKSSCCSIIHGGDDRAGGGEGDNETIKVDLSMIPETIDHLVLTVNSFSGEKFSELKSAYGRINDDSGKEHARYTLTEMGAYTALVVGVASRKGSNWSFKAVGKLCDGRTVSQLKSVAKDIVREVR